MSEDVTLQSEKKLREYFVLFFYRLNNLFIPLIEKKDNKIYFFRTSQGHISGPKMQTTKPHCHQVTSVQAYIMFGSITLFLFLLMFNVTF